MKVLTRITLLVATIALVACNSDSGSSSSSDSENGGSGSGSGGGSTGIDAVWAMTVEDASGDTEFEAVAVGSDGSVYAVGIQSGMAEVDYGSGVTAQGDSNGYNAAIVKYNSDGEPQWARSTEDAPSRSRFLAVAVDGDGNVFAAGYQRGTGEFDYGNGVTAQSDAGGEFPGNLVLVKYNADGEAQWARTVVEFGGQSSDSQTSMFNSLAVDADGNVYAAGSIDVSSYTLSQTGDSEISVSGSGGGETFPVLVKYDTDGTAKWARSITGSNYSSGNPPSSEFHAVAVSDDGDVYAVGRQGRSLEHRYGSGVSAEGDNSARNAVIVKYDSDGDAQWARSVEVASSRSEFYAVAVDSSGHVYAAGYQRGDGDFTYGNGVTTSAGTDTSSNAVLVSYNSEGEARWAQAVQTAEDDSEFQGVAVDSSGTIVAAGYLTGSGSFGFGNDVEVDGASEDENALLVAFDDDGVAQEARTVSGVSFSSEFNGVAADGYVYAVGFQAGGESFEYGDDVSATGKLGIDNAVIVKY